MNNMVINVIKAGKNLFRKNRLLVVILSFGISFSAHADYWLNEGFTPITTDSVNIKTSTSITSWTFNVLAPTFFGIGMSSSPWLSGSCSGASVPKMTTIDGYSGIELSPGVLLVIYNSTLTSTARQAYYGLATQTATFNAMGSLYVNIGTEGSGNVCYDVRDNPAQQQLNLSDVRSTVGNIKYGIYVKPGTASTIMTVPYILIGKLNASSSWVSQPLSLSQQKLYINYFECSITPPAPVNFGQVNITGKPANTLLAAKSMNLAINCKGSNQMSKTVSVAFDGTFAGATWGRLSMSNASNAVMGYIRGRYATDAGTCASDTNTEVAFNGNTSKVINNVSVGLTSIPITWSLCTNDANLYGEGTAQATVNVSWN